LVLLSAPEPLIAAHDVSEFSCGKPTLDHWLKTRALSNQEKGFTAVLVVHTAGRVVGYFGLAPTAVIPDIVPRSIRTGQPPDPVPCLLLGQLATDAGWAGRGIGSGLERCVTAAGLVGGRALLVNAIDPEAAAYWRRRGFIPSKVTRSCCSARLPRLPLRWPTRIDEGRPGTQNGHG
jgi:GNAT superfamily N-acetyltransferase